MTVACNDPNRVIDDNTEIANRNWSYANQIRFEPIIDDPSTAYNLYFNVRVTGDYKYSNLYLLLHTSGPNMKAGVMRYQLKLANAEGAWLGSGTGNLYSFRIPFKTNYHFPAKGTYHFSIEQNMRDNPLREVSDVGIRVEKVK